MLPRPQRFLQVVEKCFRKRGEGWQQLEYALGVDFELADRPTPLDNYIEAHDLPRLQNVRIGHFFEPFSLERVTQNRNNTFMERSLVDTFAPARNMGIMTYGNTESELATWQIGTFRTNSDNVGNDSFDSGQALTMRGTALPYWDEPSDGRYYMHLGVAYSYRGSAGNNLRFRNTPEIRKQQPFGSPTYDSSVPQFAPIFVDTGNISASSFQLPAFRSGVCPDFRAALTAVGICLRARRSDRQA